MESESSNSHPTSGADDPARAKGQSHRLQRQHEDAGGPLGIFREEAKQHDPSIREVMKRIAAALKREHPDLVFRHRWKIPKKEIHDRLLVIDPRLGKVLFVENAEIKPDGGITEVLDRFDQYRVALVSESKHQGNDFEKIRAGIMQGKHKTQDLMVAGNAIERVHKGTSKNCRFPRMGKLAGPREILLQLTFSW